VKIKTLYTCCEQGGRSGKDYEKKQNFDGTHTLKISTAKVKVKAFNGSDYITAKIITDNRVIHFVVHTCLFTVGVEVFVFSLITLRHTPQSVGLLWTRDRPVAEIST
jgi:hypothetical protein